SQLPNPSWAPDEHHDWCFIDLDSEMSINEVVLNKKRPFAQAMQEQNLVMKEWLRKRLEVIPSESRVLELFCGGGNFTEVLLEKFSNLHACEFQMASLEKLQVRFPLINVSAVNLYHRKSLE